VQGRIPQKCRPISGSHQILVNLLIEKAEMSGTCPEFTFPNTDDFLALCPAGFDRLQP